MVEHLHPGTDRREGVAIGLGFGLGARVPGADPEDGTAAGQHVDAW